VEDALRQALDQDLIQRIFEAVFDYSGEASPNPNL
jgi:hypothetical protein